MSGKVAACDRCGRVRATQGHGLCGRCRVRAVRDGTIPLRPHKTSEGTFEEYEWLRDSGESWKNAARRMGMTWQALYQVLYRHGYRYDKLKGGYFRDR